MPKTNKKPEDLEVEQGDEADFEDFKGEILSPTKAWMVEGPAWAQDLSTKLRQIWGQNREMVHLYRCQLLGPEKVLQFFSSNGEEIAMYLPMAEYDVLQRSILHGRNFYEKNVLEKVQAMGIVNSNSTVCDVGTNIGNHVIYFSKVLRAKKVFGFEPQPHIFRMFKKNIELNGLEGCVEAHNCLVGPVSGSGRLTEHRAKNSGATSYEPDEKGDVEMIALDDLLKDEDLKSLDLIKIDVEGMQDEVLEGAKRVLKDRKPALWVEIFAQDDAKGTTQKMLTELGYERKDLWKRNFLFVA